MPRVTADVDVGDFLAALGIQRADLPANFLEAIRERDAVEMKVHVDQDTINDEADPDTPYPDVITLDPTDFREALRTLLEGDLTIAGVLFARALQDDEEAAAVAEDEIRRAIAGRRKPQQLAVAA